MARKMRWEDIDADVSASGAASAPASLKTEVESATAGVSSISIGGSAVASSGELPPSEKHGPDADGVYTSVTYQVNEAGVRTKTVKRYKEHEVTKKVTRCSRGKPGKNLRRRRGTSRETRA